MKNRYYDNTRLSDHRRCNRYFFWRHRANLVPVGTGLALVFGQCWHLAMERLWPDVNAGLPDKEVLLRAAKAFIDGWTEHNLPVDPTPEEADNMSPRTVATAVAMLEHYIAQRKAFIKNCKLISIERPFAVPIDPNDPTLLYVGRKDKVVCDDRGKILPVEHKTTTAYLKDGGFKRSFTDSFSPNSQVDGYIHAQIMESGPENVRGLYVDAALVHEKVHDKFMMIPVTRMGEMLDAWLYETHTEISRIEANDLALAEVKPSDPYMAAFGKNTSACQDYGGCAYVNLCKGVTNPAKYLAADAPVPSGYKRSAWEPFSVLKLEQIGLPAETANG